MLYAKVINGSLNMRADTSIDSPKITMIPNGSRIAITELGSVWAKAIYNEYSGYVMIKYLKLEDEEPEEKESDTVSIVLSRETAKLLYEALKLSLEK